MTRLAVAALLLGAALVTIAAGDGTTTVTHDDPAFGLEIDPDRVRRAEPRSGELLRLTAGKASLVVRPLELPPYSGDVAGLLPVYATNHAPARPRQEGKARINQAPGYQLELGDGGLEVFLVPHARARAGVVLSLRGRSRALRSALRTFEFG